jgi:hypothetical protein
MNNNFSAEETDQIYKIVDTFQGIFDRATFLSAQMETMEIEMTELAQKMATAQGDELELYAAVSERTGASIDDLKNEAANLAVERKKIVEMQN